MNTHVASEAVYTIGDQRWAREAPGFAYAIANAHESHLRPRCLCQPDQPCIDTEDAFQRFAHCVPSLN